MGALNIQIVYLKYAHTVEQVRMAGAQGGSACRVRLAGARAGYTWQGRVAEARILYSLPSITTLLKTKETTLKIELSLQF
jgi:hypothetical protein